MHGLGTTVRDLLVRRPPYAPVNTDGTLPRYAAIDIGTNTIKMTIAALRSDGELIHVEDAAATPRLGEGIHSGWLTEAAMQRALNVLRQCLVMCQERSVAEVAVVGTAALREACNQTDFVARAKQLGLTVEVLSGEDEARLSCLAVRSDSRWMHAGRLMVLDIGGGSTEVVYDDQEGQVQQRVSLRLGAVRLTERLLRSDPPAEAELEEARQLVRASFAELQPGGGGRKAVGVGGTLTNMGAVALLHDGAPDTSLLHGLLLTLGEIRRQIAQYASLTNVERRSIPGLDPGRSDVILAGALILEGALLAHELPEIAVSCRGLRWGVLYDRFARKDGVA